MELCKSIKLSDYKLTHIWEDKIEAWDHFINLATDPKEKKWLMKQKSRTLRYPNYIAWKNKTSNTIVVKTNQLLYQLSYKGMRNNY